LKPALGAGDEEEHRQNEGSGAAEAPENEPHTEANPASPGLRSNAEIRTLNPRARLVANLTATIAEATATGDLHTAREAHEMLGRMLAQSAAGAPAVVDLSEERARREGRG